VSLTHKQLVALAGAYYQHKAAALEADPDLGPDTLGVDKAAWDQGVEHYLNETGGDLEAAEFCAALDMENGPAFLAYVSHRKRGGCFFATLDEVLEAYLGHGATGLLERHGLHIDGDTRKRLLREMARVVDAVGDKVDRNLAGNYSPDPIATTFPSGRPPPPPRRRNARRPAPRRLIPACVDPHL